MKQRFVVGNICVVVAATWLASTPVAAQGGGGGPIDPAARLVETPRDANGHPILGGIWAATERRGEQATNNTADGSNIRGFTARKGTL